MIDRDNEEDDWHMFLNLVMLFQDQVSLLHYLERECHKIDQLLPQFDNTPSRHRASNCGIEAYNLSYFAEDPDRWSLKFHMWNANPLIEEKSWEDSRMEWLVASKTADFALLEVLEESLDDSIQL